MFAAQQLKCAVLTFERGSSSNVGQAAYLCNEFAELLADTGRYSVISRRRSSKELSRRGIYASGYPSLNDYATVAGRMLKADHVVIGSVKEGGAGRAFKTSLVEVQTGKIIRTVTTPYAGRMAQLARSVAGFNLRSLLEPEQTVPVTTRPEVGRPEPRPRLVQPVPRRVEQVKPAPSGTAGRDSRAAPPAEQVEIPPAAPRLKKPRSLSPAGGRNWRAESKQLWEETALTVADYLEVGTRITMFRLNDAYDSGGFVGSINKLGEDQDFSPFKLFVVGKVNPRWGLELTRDEIRAEARNSFNSDSDGTFVLGGPIVTVFRRFPNQSRWTPYAGLGLAFFSGSFDHSAWWRNGYQNESDYIALGPAPRFGKTRRMALDDARGIVVCGGCSVQLRERLYGDITLRSLSVDSAASFSASLGRRVVRREGSFHIPFDHLALGLGVKYVF